MPNPFHTSMAMTVGRADDSERKVTGESTSPVERRSSLMNPPAGSSRTAKTMPTTAVVVTTGRKSRSR